MKDLFCKIPSYPVHTAPTPAPLLALGQQEPGSGGLVLVSRCVFQLACALSRGRTVASSSLHFPHSVHVWGAPGLQDRWRTEGMTQ